MKNSAKKKGISAIDENGNSIDWWFAYKVPKMPKKKTQIATTGYEYLYFDANSDKMIQSSNLMNDGKGALDLTLFSIFNKPTSNIGWIIYNDEIPNKPKSANSTSYGHTKGVIAFDVATNTAFWLLHSWPKYANPKIKKLPTPDFGQTFLCISLDLDTAGYIANQMINNQEPQIYSSRIPATLSKTHPLYLLTKNVNPNAQSDSNVLTCTSKGGMKFKVIAKNRKWGKDFWNDLVGPYLKANMDIESWIRGTAPSVKDSDGIHKTVDVKYIDFIPLGFPFTWAESQDHAKWGLTVSSDWICVGDINRMISQEKRGGGTIAFQNKKLWSQLQKTDLIVPPKGKTIAQTKKIISSTHQPISTATKKSTAKKKIVVTKKKAVATQPSNKKISPKQHSVKKTTVKKTKTVK